MANDRKVGDITLEFDSKAAITGETAVKEAKGGVDLVGFSWSVGPTESNGKGYISCSHKTDAATPSIMDAAFSKKKIDKCILTVHDSNKKAGGKPSDPLNVYTLMEVFVQGYHVEAEGKEPLGYFTLAFDECVMQTKKLDGTSFDTPFNFKH